MDIKQLKEQLLDDTDKIKEILSYIGCDRIVKLSNEYRCAKSKSDTNPTRVSVKFDDNVSSRIYDLYPVKGDIFVIIMDIKKCSLSESIKICCDVLGIKYTYKSVKSKKEVKKAFGGFYNNIKNKKPQKEEFIIHDDSILSNYINKGNVMFKKDGIEYDVQTEFNIMFDDFTNRIVVPWRDLCGNIVGIMGRYHDSAEYCEQNGISKWLPFENLSFRKSQLLYGLYQNYQYILQEGRVYVFESEKSVLQMASFGLRNAVAIGSHDISETQRNILLSLGVDIITCMDEGIPDEFNAEQCQKLKSKSKLIGGKVGFSMVDGILNSKESPSDRGLEVFNMCVAEDNIFWV